MCLDLVCSDIIVLGMVFNLSAARNINILSAAPRTKNRNLSLTDHDEPASKHRFGPETSKYIWTRDEKVIPRLCCMHRYTPSSNVLPHSHNPKILRRTKTRTKASKPRYSNNAPQISFYVILAGPESFFDLPGCGTTVLDPADNLKMSPVGRQMIKKTMQKTPKGHQRADARYRN